MFETEGYAKVPVHGGLQRPGHASWEFVYRTAQVPWLHAVLGRPLEGIMVYDPYFLNDVGVFMDMVGAGLQPKHLDLVVPTRNGTWKMKAVAEIWKVNPEDRHDIFLQFERSGGYLCEAGILLNAKESNTIPRHVLVCRV